MKYIPVLSKDKLEPCLDGGLLPVRELGLEFGLEPGLEPLGVNPDRNVEVFLIVLGNVELSLSESESGVLAVSDVRDVLD